MTVQAIRSAVEAAIQHASQATGVDFGFLLGAARRESGYNPGARAGSSSAAGLFQFVEQTWLATLKRHGSKYGYGSYADSISQGEDGRYYVSDSRSRKAVMDLRLDAHASSLMAGELAADHASYLRGRVGRDPTAGELYAAHFLGPKGSARLIEAAQSTPGASAAAMFPDAAEANHAVFYRDGRPLTVAALYQRLTQDAGEPGVVQADQPSEGFVHDAAGRRLQRLEQERLLLEMVLRGPEQPDAATGLGGSAFSPEMVRMLSQTYGQNSRS